MAGTLFIVATPIGNLGDVTRRGCEVLSSVAVIAAEDTRHTGRLLAQLGIQTPLVAIHEHNEQARAPELVARMLAGDDVALVSDAGTPLVSDPGYRLVDAAVSAGVRVTPIPGACALIAALSVAGLPTDRFAFEGFLPQKAAARRARLVALASEQRTLVFYESPHRLAASLADLAECLGAQRPAVIARELTKLHETVYRGTLAGLQSLLSRDTNLARGELVIVVGGSVIEHHADDGPRADALLQRLLPHAPLAVVVDAVAECLGIRRNVVYDRALQLKRAVDDDSA